MSECEWQTLTVRFSIDEPLAKVDGYALTVSLAGVLRDHFGGDVVRVDTVNLFPGE